MYEVFTKLLNMSIMASVLAVFVMLLRLILKKVPRKYICILWALVAIRLIIPMGFFSNLSFYNVMDVPTDESGQIEYFQYTSHAEKPEIVFTVPVVSHEEYTVEHEVTTSHTKDLYLPVIINIWIVGVAFMILSAFISFIRLKGEVAASVRKEGRIYTCDDISSPFILGIIMPRIYIPSGMPDEIREHVIAHEQAHLRRLDHLWKPLGFFILSIHWFNPVIWVSYILLCRDIEAACDEKVISGMDKEKISGYSEALLTCATHRRLITACPVAFGETDVKSRVKNVLNYKKPAFWVIIIAVIACIVVAVCFLTNPIGTDDPTDITDESALYEPPILTVVYDGKEYKQAYGPSTWNYIDEDGKGHGFTSDGVHPLFDNYMNGRIINGNDSVGHMRLSFAREPESVYVRYWSDIFMNDPDSYEDNYSEASYDPETGEIGFQTGSGLIFEVKGTWPEGTACYSFYLTMEGGSESRLTSSEGTVTEVVGAQAVVVYTVYAGTVTEVGYDDERGNYVIITDQYGSVSGYDHLSEVYVYEGFELNVGAAVGNRYFDIGIDNPIGLTMSVKTVRPGGCDLVFEQSGVSVDGSLITGCAYDLQQLNESGEWVGFFPETLAWNEIAYDILKGTTTELSVTWEVICGQLPAGHYRIVKSVMHFKTDGGYDTYLLYAEFDMGNGADSVMSENSGLNVETEEDNIVALSTENNNPDDRSEVGPDSFVPRIIPIYISSDVILEKVRISSNEADEGVITSTCDFNEDGKPEKVIVDYSDILKEGIAVPGKIAVYDIDGNELWNYTFGLPYAGWSRFYIAEIDNLPYLIRYFPPLERQGSWESILQVYTLNSDNEFISSEVISCDGTKESAEECKTIAEQYLEHAVMLVSTMDSELKVYK